ncbi:hypothetical protein K2X30_00360 [bacterium]|nr:hypothetical protein [bacterium]
MKFRLGILIILLWGGLTGAVATAWGRCDVPSNRYVRSAIQLSLHETMHARNVHSLMLTLARLHPEEYGDVMPYLIGEEGFGSHHDQPKQHTDILKGLCEIYGRAVSTPSERAVVDLLHLREAQVEREILFRLKLVNARGIPLNSAAEAIIAKLRRIEKIADNAERLSNPISLFEELGEGVSFERTAKVYLKDPKMIAQCRELMDIYQKNSSEFLGYVSVIEAANGRGQRIQTRQLIARAETRIKNQIIEIRQQHGRFIASESGILIPDTQIIQCPTEFTAVAR